MANLPGTKAFEAIYTEVSTNVLNRLATTGDSPLTLTRVKQIVNDTQREICTERDWPWLYTEANFSLVKDQTTAHVLPDECQILMGIAIPSENVVLGEVSWETWTSIYPERYSGQTSGQPESYIKASVASNGASQVFIWPSPADNYTARIFYRKRVTDMSATTDVSVIPVDWQDVLIAKATASCFMALNDKKSDERAAIWMSRYNARWADMFIQCENSGYVKRLMETYTVLSGRSDADLWRFAVEGY